MYILMFAISYNALRDLYHNLKKNYTRNLPEHLTNNFVIPNLKQMNDIYGEVSELREM